MKKIILVLIICLLPLSAFSQKQQVPDFKKDIKEIHVMRDSALNLGKQYFKLLKKESKIIGIKKTIQINGEFFGPVIVFGLMYLLWLSRRSKQK